MNEETQLKIGTKVEKVGGDYTFVGVVVAAFVKLGGQLRYVVEDDRGVLHIYSGKNLKVKEDKPEDFSCSVIVWELPGSFTNCWIAAKSNVANEIADLLRKYVGGIVDVRQVGAFKVEPQKPGTPVPDLSYKDSHKDSSGNPSRTVCGTP